MNAIHKITLIDPTRPTLLPVKGEDWEVLTDIKYVYTKHSQVMEIVVPKGYLFNGASVPRFLWRVAGHPMSIETLTASIIHDYCFTNRPWVGIAGYRYRISFQESADLYVACLVYNQAHWWTRFSHNIAIRSPFARAVWNSHNGEFQSKLF